ncbi:MAG: hypothetical protein KDB62_10485, partial [Solirubrobacterales bacterium]|nr:hypothetical protein [Solirubrobacterales bacterium]
MVFSIGLAALALAAGSAVASASPQGPWDPPVQDLSAAGQNATQPRVTTGPDGAATAIWRRSNGTNNIIQAATRPPGGSFSPPVDLSAPGQDADAPQVVTAPDGTTTVVWQRSDGANVIIQARTRPSGGSFGTTD